MMRDFSLKVNVFCLCFVYLFVAFANWDIFWIREVGTWETIGRVFLSIWVIIFVVLVHSIPFILKKHRR